MSSISIGSLGGGSNSAFDSWIAAPYRTAEAHLNNQTIVQKIKVVVPKHLKSDAREMYVRGAEIYQREGYCATCHQPDGLGLEAAGFPPLSKSPWVTQSDDRLIKLTLHGLLGPIEVKGKKYPGLVPMTPFGGMLKDAEIASVLTYVRNSFGNKAPTVSADQVKQIRAATKSKVGFYAPDELLKAHPFQKKGG